MLWGHTLPRAVAICWQYIMHCLCLVGKISIPKVYIALLVTSSSQWKKYPTAFNEVHAGGKLQQSELQS